MPRYAEINLNTGIVEGDSLLRDINMEKNFPNLIPIDDSFDLTNKKWDFKNNEWVEYIASTEEQSISRPTQLDRIESMVAKSQEEIAQEGAQTIITELIDRGIL